MSSNDPNANCKSITESFFKTAVLEVTKHLLEIKIYREQYTQEPD